MGCFSLFQVIDNVVFRRNFSLPLRAMYYLNLLDLLAYRFGCSVWLKDMRRSKHVGFEVLLMLDFV